MESEIPLGAKPPILSVFSDGMSIDLAVAGRVRYCSRPCPLQGTRTEGFHVSIQRIPDRISLFCSCRKWLFPKSRKMTTPDGRSAHSFRRCLRHQPIPVPPSSPPFAPPSSASATAQQPIPITAGSRSTPTASIGLSRANATTDRRCVGSNVQPHHDSQVPSRPQTLGRWSGAWPEWERRQQPELQSALRSEAETEDRVQHPILGTGLQEEQRQLHRHGEQSLSRFTIRASFPGIPLDLVRP